VPNQVLIVDDDELTCELIRDVLSMADIEACGLTNTAAAAQRLRQQKFDAVFLDSRMPSPDGLELTRQMRSSGLNRKSLVVMITGDREKNFMARAFEAGVNFVLFKPVDRQSLLRLLRVTQAPIDQERRRSARVNIQRKISLKYGNEHAEGTTVDMSTSGMLVKSARRFPIGSILQVVVELERGKPPLHSSARIVRLTGQECMGLEFESPAQADRDRLESFLVPHILQLQRNGETSEPDGAKGLAPERSRQLRRVS
jgi:CheY-like chemotaxis protein